MNGALLGAFEELSGTLAKDLESIGRAPAERRQRALDHNQGHWQSTCRVLGGHLQSNIRAVVEHQ